MAYTAATTAAAGQYMQVKVTRTGRIKEPNLSNSRMADIGHDIVAAQLLRWSKGINAYGQPAKQLSKKYFFVKKKVTGQWRPFRDNKMTGALVKNFSLRKATQNEIRAEPTQRLTRMESLRAEQYDHMTGFADSDLDVMGKSMGAAYTQWSKTAWQATQGG